MPNYRDLTSDEFVRPCYLKAVPLRDGTEVIGVYENRPDSGSDAVVVSTDGLYTYEGGDWRFVPYQAVRSVDYLKGKTVDVAGIVVRLSDGSVVEIPVTGGNCDAGTRDAAEFMRFVLRASAQSA
jgi:hypothetical protein